MLLLSVLLVLGALLYFCIVDPDTGRSLVDRVRRLFGKGNLPGAAIALMLLAGGAQAQTCEFSWSTVEKIAAARGDRIVPLTKEQLARVTASYNDTEPKTNLSFNAGYVISGPNEHVVFLVTGGCVEAMGQFDDEGFARLLASPGKSV